MFSFSGPATKLSPADITAAAAKIGCLREAVLAVLTVETGGAGGFLGDGSGRPRILFEAAKFSAATGHAYDATHPGISSRLSNYKLYKGGAAEYDRLAEALALDETAALESTSWGLFQIMGFNALTLRYDSVQQFVAEMVESEANHLDAFVSFVRLEHLDDDLAALNWAGFARGYNGASYAVNRYDTKLQAAFQAACGVVVAGVYRLGSTGATVRAVQLALTSNGYPCGTVDGIYGRATELAVRRFQSMMGLQADGVTGPRTLALLDVRPA